MEYQSIEDDVNASGLEGWLSRLQLNWFLFGLALLLTLVAWNRGIALLYGFVVLLIAIIVVAWFAPRVNLAGISVKRSTPATGQEGSQVKLQLELQHTGWFSKYLIEVWDSLPFAVEQHQQAMTLVPVLQNQQTLTVSVPCELRGVHRLGPITIKTGFPLGLTQRKKQIFDSEASIVIYPAPIPLRQYDLGRFRSQHSDQHQIQQTKGYDEFSGVREYQRGDSMRHVHWPSSARRGQLIVKEFNPLTSTHVSVLLEQQQGSNVGAGKHTTLEYAVKIAASIGDYALKNTIPFSLGGGSQQLQAIEAYSSFSQREQLLTSLAWAQDDARINYEQLITAFVTRQKTGGSVILFDNGLVDLDASINLLLSHYYQPIIYRFDVPTFEAGRQHPSFMRTEEHGIPVFFVQCGTDLESLLHG